MEINADVAGGVMKILDGVYVGVSGNWEVWTCNKRVDDGGLTHREAWRLYDRYNHEPKSKAEDTSDWIWKKSLHR